MDATQVYKEINDALDCFHEDTPVYNLYEFKLRGLLDKCRAEIEVNTLSGVSKDRFKAALSFAKACQKEMADNKPMLAGAWVDEMGRMGICDKISLAVYEKPYEGLPMAEIPVGEKTIRIDEITPRGYNANGILPDPRILKAAVKGAKLDFKGPSKEFEHLTFIRTGKLSQSVICLGTENLITAIECAGSQTFQYFQDNPLKPIKIDGDKCYVLLVPVKFTPPEDGEPMRPSYTHDITR